MFLTFAMYVLGWSLCGGLALVVYSKSVRRFRGPDGTEIEETHESNVPERAVMGAMIALASLAFWGGATTSVLGGLGRGGGTGSTSPNPPSISDLSSTVVDTSTTRVMFTVTPASGSAHDSSRIVIRRLAGDTLIDSIFGSAVLDTVLASNTNLKADTSYVTVVRGHATNGAGWSGEAVDTFANTASTWPNNEPAGMTVIASTDGSDKYFGTGGSGTGWFFGARWLDATYVAENVTASGSPYGTAILKKQFVGDPAGWLGYAQYDWSSTAGAKRHIYFRTVFKFSSNYQVCSTNEKPFGYLGTPAGHMYIYMNPSRHWFFANEMTGRGFDYFDLGTTVSFNQWITLELYLVGESSAGANDGEYYVWVNGSQVASATGQNWSSGSSAWTYMQIFNYWGGGGCTKTVNDTIYIGEIYLSGKN